MNEVMQIGSRPAIRRRLLLTVSSAAVLVLAGQSHADNDQIVRPSGSNSAGHSIR